MINKVLILAEAGFNHNGSVEISKKMIDAAKIVRVKYIKFKVCNF